MLLKLFFLFDCSPNTRTFCIAVHALHKGAFRDASVYSMGDTPLVSHAFVPVRRTLLRMEHAMNCPTGGFPTIQAS